MSMKTTSDQVSAPNPSTPEVTRKRAMSNPFHPANSRIPTIEEVRDLPVGGVMYYRGSTIVRVAPHALRVNDPDLKFVASIKNHPKDAIDYAVHEAELGSMTNCYKKYISALEALLGEGSAFDDMLAALKAARESLRDQYGINVVPRHRSLADCFAELKQIDAAIQKAGGQ